MKSKTTIDMTNGPLLGNILLFSLPLMASNILQILFNAADVVVVGRFAGHTSLAAVGSTVSVIFLFTNLLIGLAVGVNVVIARYLGLTGYEREISRTLHTSVLVALVGGTLLGLIGIAATGWVLDLISVPEDVRSLAATYMRIYFIGTPVNMLYNYGAAALRAKGDTRRPLIFLLISGVLNVVLNLIFVIPLQMNVVGVGLATVISQGLSAVLVLHCLSQAEDELRFSWRDLCLDRRSLIDIARIGIPAGVQSCLFSLANVVIQGAINSYDSIIMAGSSAAANIENFLYSSMNSFHHACQTFTSQNVGAGRYDRIGRIVRTCILCTIVLGVTQSALADIFARPLISIYNSDPAVITAGAERLVIMATPYVIFGCADVLVGAIRGYGYPIAPVIINLLGTCGFRLLWISLLDTSKVSVHWVYMSFPISWVLISLALIPFWIYLRRREHRVGPRSGHPEKKLEEG
ncbi:MATE family efflux transporter [Butyricicoccus faecihominis]|uniref:MATE family efflux transporter n=1 Tax=Butyricicoccus faecihominis TaxID=1712515 RepID=UPI002479781C|nr:MATE family efflux transporter [Butyricicoccus faecihominis]